MAACTARRLREQDFNCVPNAIGVDLITTIIACTGRYRGGYRQRERERERKDHSNRFVPSCSIAKMPCYLNYTPTIASPTLPLFFSFSLNRSINDFEPSSPNLFPVQASTLLESWEKQRPRQTANQYDRVSILTCMRIWQDAYWFDRVPSIPVCSYSSITRKWIKTSIRIVVRIVL